MMNCNKILWRKKSDLPIALIPKTRWESVCIKTDYKNINILPKEDDKKIKTGHLKK